ncbi:hypothetical protein NDU88_003273 [Pleurodeles waltl]|uniref:Uncharacterized protein n=1 Tax=Pleurodeles waltl TaxID=8319 RepID=A0AAV7T526_PLEWA|nr:hypothetical protein NDU88_003273 [Pleurodeles waltl]
MPCAICANAPVSKISRRPKDKYSHALRSLCAPVSKIQKEHISREVGPTTAEARPSDPRVQRQLTGSEPRTRIVKQSCLEKNTKSKGNIAQETLRVRQNGEFEEHLT